MRNYRDPIDPTDEFNMNMGWIEFLNRLLFVYGNANFADDYWGMYKCLKLMESTLSPKIEYDKVEINLMKIKKNLRQMIVKNKEGQIIKYYPDLIDATVELLDETYSLIMIKMDEAGVLTRKPKDPKKAFGNFRGS